MPVFMLAQGADCSKNIVNMLTLSIKMAEIICMGEMCFSAGGRRRRKHQEASALIETIESNMKVAVFSRKLIFLIVLLISLGLIYKVDCVFGLFAIENCKS